MRNQAARGENNRQLQWEERERRQKRGDEGHGGPGKRESDQKEETDMVRRIYSVKKWPGSMSGRRC